MKPLHISSAVALGLSCFLPVAAQASVSTAAWAMASSVCRSLAAGLSIPDAARVGLSDTQLLFSAEVRDPAFNPLMTAEATRMCPDLLIRAVNRGQQL